MTAAEKECEICGRKPAQPHHLMYKKYLNPDDKDYVIHVCDWHHKVITKTAFMRTMNFMFEDRWAQYKAYLKKKEAQVES